MGGLEGLIKPLGWPQRLVETGWDLCILGVGVGAGVFGAPERLKKLGVEVVSWLRFALLIAIGASIVILHIRKTLPASIKGWHGLAALACGGIALAMPFYFVIRWLRRA